MNLTDIAVRLTSTFKGMQELISRSDFCNQVRISIEDNSGIANSLLSMLLVVHVVGRHNDDDFGLVLAVDLLRYDPRIDRSTFSDQELFVTANLSRSDGNPISSFGVERIEYSNDLERKLSQVGDRLVEYLDRQIFTIQKALRESYELK